MPEVMIASRWKSGSCVAVTLYSKDTRDGRASKLKVGGKSSLIRKSERAWVHRGVMLKDE